MGRPGGGGSDGGSGGMVVADSGGGGSDGGGGGSGGDSGSGGGGGGSGGGDGETLMGDAQVTRTGTLFFCDVSTALNTSVFPLILNKTLTGFNIPVSQRAHTLYRLGRKKLGFLSGSESRGVTGSARGGGAWRQRAPGNESFLGICRNRVAVQLEAVSHTDTREVPAYRGAEERRQIHPCTRAHTFM